MINVYDGLVAFRRAGGAAGGTLVPDLATRVPAPAADGKTYTFQVRRGVRYSNGQEVRPRDFRYAIERVLTKRPQSLLVLLFTDRWRGFVHT